MNNENIHSIEAISKSIDDIRLVKKLQAQGVLYGFLELAKYIVENERQSLNQLYTIRHQLIQAMVCGPASCGEAWAATVAPCDRIRKLRTRQFTDKIAYITNGKAISLHFEDHFLLVMQDIELLVAHAHQCIDATQNNIFLIAHRLELAAEMHLSTYRDHIPAHICQKLDIYAQRNDVLFKEGDMRNMAEKIAAINSATMEAA